MKVNARLTGEVESRFIYLQEHTDLSRSDIIKMGINLLYEQQLAAKISPVEIFRKNFGDITQGSGRDDLSVNYKKLLGDSVNEKYHR